MSYQNAIPPEPLLWFFAGHDASGGAGIQADIEVAAAFGLPAVSFITASTVQNSQGVMAVQSTPADWLAAQIAAIIADFPQPSAIKISVIGSPENLEVIGQALESLNCPLLFDPILRAGSLGDLQSGLTLALVEKLLPRVTLLTPNLPELFALAGIAPPTLSPADAANENAIAHAVAFLQGRGTSGIFLSGGHHGAENTLVNRLFWREHGEIGRWAWPRLAGNFHGSGCTLAAALLCALVKQNQAWPEAWDAWEKAQAFTYESLRTARPLGKRQAYPQRQKKS